MLSPSSGLEWVGLCGLGKLLLVLTSIVLQQESWLWESCHYLWSEWVDDVVSHVARKMVAWIHKTGEKMEPVSGTLKKEAACSSKISVSTYNTTWCHYTVMCWPITVAAATLRRCYVTPGGEGVSCIAQISHTTNTHSAGTHLHGYLNCTAECF